MSDDKNVVIYRLKQCESAMKMAMVAWGEGEWAHVCNRLYYAAFYVVTAYLASVNDNVKTHNGVRIKVHSFFVKSNLIKKETGDLYDELFHNRQEADYSDFAIFTKEDVFPLIEETREFIETIKTFIKI